MGGVQCRHGVQRPLQAPRARHPLRHLPVPRPARPGVRLRGLSAVEGLHRGAPPLQRADPRPACQEQGWFRADIVSGSGAFRSMTVFSHVRIWGENDLGQKSYSYKFQGWTKDLGLDLD